VQLAEYTGFAGMAIFGAAWALAKGTASTTVLLPWTLGGIPIRVACRRTAAVRADFRVAVAKKMAAARYGPPPRVNSPACLEGRMTFRPPTACLARSTPASWRRAARGASRFSNACYPALLQVHKESKQLPEPADAGESGSSRIEVQHSWLLKAEIFAR